MIPLCTVPLQVGFELLTYNVSDGNLLEVCATLSQPTEGGAAVLENPVQVTVTSSNIDAIGMSPLSNFRSVKLHVCNNGMKLDRARLH